MDDDALTALAQASKTSEAKMNKLVRHHQFLENLEERKLQLHEKREERESKNGQWKDKTDELEYKMKLLEKYKELKDKYGWTDAQVLALCPEMEPIINARHLKSRNVLQNNTSIFFTSHLLALQQQHLGSIRPLELRAAPDPRYRYLRSHLC
jgi:predicted nuclease with TOPRIM domain